ncbi:unnamed protein product [Porites evermanni]|uniref:FP protein C-terminal domain-containing protein n=1 Tax=Porites evermanni TaxID=104178 RepID=A0ABN8SLS6_9CNID|nr:unnamed protein product [Porites evermanni]
MPKETIASLKQQNQLLKQQVDALCKEVKSLKESFAAMEAVNENRITAVANASNVETARSLRYLNDEYDDLSASDSSISVQLKQIFHCLNVLTAQVERESSSLCVKLFQEMGAEVSILDIDIAHRVSKRNESKGPKPVVCKFGRRLAKGKVMEIRQRASQVNPTSIDFSAENELGGATIFDHLTPKKQNLLFDAKKFKERNHYQFCWAKNSTIYLRKDESSRVIKISDTNTLRHLASDTYSLKVR